jgi:hypothetical protein
MITDIGATCTLTFSSAGNQHRRSTPAGGTMPQSLASMRLLYTVFVILVCRPALLPAQQPRPQRPGLPENLYDARLNELRIASVAWSTREGKPRQVVDVACLVPDMATFLEVISTWDADHFFPVLIDDATYSLKFLRAFRPSRVVRFPRKAAPIQSDELWQRAASAVGKSWRTKRDSPPESGDGRPPGREPGTPGAVITSVFSPTLAAGVALAAGRFQPMLRWEPAKGFSDRLTDREAGEMALDIERVVNSVFPEHGRLGDDCDFVTMACDYPYDYDNPNPPEPGRSSFDDRIGFVPRTSRRWAHSGRLLGDPISSVYRAMCSLFLQPNTVLLFDTYKDDGDFPLYTVAPASRRLASLFKLRAVSGPEAGLDGWRRTFSPENRNDLLIINSSGGPDAFNTRDGIAGLGDVPDGVPSIVHMIESHAAHNPTDSNTIAARWLEGGAYMFFGASEEPYLNSFRTPTLLADLIATGIPLSAAFRQGPGEQFPFPWRLVLLGDPLYRILPKEQRRKRTTWDAVDDWPSYSRPTALPNSNDGGSARLAWALKDAIATASQTGPEALVDHQVLLSIRREDLPDGRKSLYDDLLADALPRSRQAGVVRVRLEAIPARERSAGARRILTHPVTAVQRRPTR